MKLIIVLFFVILRYAICLQNVRVIFPESVPEGGVATLLCLYDIEGEPLYTVKWYRGSIEIFRYSPREKPRVKIFPFPGLHIDLNSSNAHRLILLDIPKYLGGNFTCEVTADAPSYVTGYVTQYLQVVRNESDANGIPIEKYIKLNISKTNVNSGTHEIGVYYYFHSIILIILFIVK